MYCIFKKNVVPLQANMEHLSKAQIKWVRSLQQKKFRDAEGVFVAEGEKCVSELKRRFELLLLITPDNASPAEIEQMSSLRTPQGVIGVFKRTFNPLPEDKIIRNEQLCVVLDGVQDPGNLGTIIRTCDWFGIRNIICSRDTADCFNPKVVQATMGALARVWVYYTDDLAQLLKNYREDGYPIYGTLLDGCNMYTPNAIPDKHTGFIVMGNEGNGISQEVKATITHPLYIPSYPVGVPTSESLNVGIATAIVLAEFRRTTHTP